MSPDLVLVGHLARDLQPDGTFRLGGTVTYAALLAQGHGLHLGILTSAPDDALDELRTLLPLADVRAVSSPTATIFENRYGPTGRVQYLRARAAPLTAAALPAAWRVAPITLLGPIADEIAPDVAEALRGDLRAATPQGWLRARGSDGRVSPVPWASAEALLPALTDLILSEEDLAIAAGALEAAERVAAWATQIPRVVLTDGLRGAALWDGGARQHIPAFPVRDVDPTGAGDTFACAYLIALHRLGDPTAAVRYAHAAASYVVAAPGIAGIPTPDQIAQRLAVV